jgi:hypothetical protein
MYVGSRDETAGQCLGKLTASGEGAFPRVDIDA